MRRAGRHRQFPARAGARIDPSAPQQLLPRIQVEFATLALRVRSKRPAHIRPLLPVDPIPTQVFEHRSAQTQDGSAAGPDPRCGRSAYPHAPAPAQRPAKMCGHGPGANTRLATAQSVRDILELIPIVAILSLAAAATRQAAQKNAPPLPMAPLSSCRSAHCPGLNPVPRSPVPRAPRSISLQMS